MMRLSLCLAFSALALPAMAQNSLFGLPKGCTAFVTVQNPDCTVSHHFTCAGDPEGYQHSVDIYADGYDVLSTTDAEGSWIMTMDSFNGTTETLSPEVVDPTSITDLLANGVNEYDFSTIDQSGVVTRFVGKESLTGETAIIDGVELLITRNKIEAFDQEGQPIWSAASHEFISPEWRLFFGGPTDWTMPDNSYSTNESPAEFILPGEPGFLSTVPEFGCEG